MRAFIGGPGCGPRGGRYGGRGFYGRGSFPCGPQGVVVVPVPGMGTGMWPGYSPPDPEQFEQYQQVSSAGRCTRAYNLKLLFCSV